MKRTFLTTTAPATITITSMSEKDFKFLQWADQGAKLFSTCSKSQYMAIIVDSEGFVLGVGYNGSPRGAAHCNEGACPRALAGSDHKSSDYSDCIAVHAEANALLHSDFNARARMGGVAMYVNGEPCLECAKLIANSGVRIVYGIRENRPALSKVEEVFVASSIDLILYDRDEVMPVPKPEMKYADSHSFTRWKEWSRPGKS